MNSSKIVCLGDSITWGYPYGPEYSWVALSGAVLGTTLINRGINGETALDLCYRFERHVISIAPDYVCIMVGTNDASIRVPVEDYKKNILKMTALAAENKIRQVLGLPIPSSDRFLENILQEYRKWLKEYSLASGIPLVDFTPVMTDNAGQIRYECYSDEVHPSKKGYRVMADLFAEFYRKVIK